MRLFVAINLPDHEKHRLADAVRNIAAHDLPVRWLPADSLHITLKFLGDVADAEVPSLRAALRRAVAGCVAFDVVIENFGAFPSLARPSIFWVGASRPPELAVLQHTIEDASEALGFAREARSFRPHITIGRLQKHAQVRDRALMDRIVAGFRYKGAFRVRSADLMRSHLGARGARYEAVERMELN